MFTKQNTSGFTAQELDTLNAALSALIGAGFNEENAQDMVNNAYFEGATAEEIFTACVSKK